MQKTEVDFTDYLKSTLKFMSRYGLLLTSISREGKANVMTIGWGTIGIIWNKPIFVVLVRPSRFTYNFIKDTGIFTVNVPSERIIEAVSFCGTVSGRDYDKFKEKELTPLPGEKVKSPLIKECLVHYECKVVHKNVVIPKELALNISSLFYPENDYHNIFFGEIMATYASDMAKESLGNF